jgi:hypothetical protein
MDIEHYVKKYKEHEQQRLSTNERNDYWKQYTKSQKQLDPETSFNMGEYT